MTKGCFEHRSSSPVFASKNGERSPTRWLALVAPSKNNPRCSREKWIHVHLGGSASNGIGRAQ